MAKAIATIGGIALAPGMSRNRRIYTKQAIAGMVARAQERIGSPDGLPLVMLSHHDAGDDTTRVVGGLTGMSVDEDGNARYRAQLADTDTGRTIAGLADSTDGQPAFLRGVSIRAMWVGGTKVIKGPDGDPAETGDDLNLLGLDFTPTPGVPTAGVDTFAWTNKGAKTETSDPVLITESVQEAHMTAITEDTAPAEATGTPAVSKRDSGLAGSGRVWADPGYQKDKKQRYDISTKAKAKAAWGYINQDDNAKLYTPAQLKRIKGRIKAALKKFGVSIAAEGWTIDPVRELTESEVAEYFGGYDSPSEMGSYSLTASNGPTNLTISSYCLDPAELDVILRAAADAACKALAVLDPDMDGDIDVDGAPNADTDSDGGESSPDEDDPAEAGTTDPAAAESETTPALVSAAGETTEGESDMTDTSTAAETQTAAPTTTGLSATDVAKIVADAFAAQDTQRRERKAAKKAQQQETAPVAAQATETAPTAETAPAATTTESEDQMIERLVQAKLDHEFPSETDEDRIARKVSERYDSVRATMVQSGQINPSRKGVVLQANETAGTADTINAATGLPTSWGDKPLHQMSQDEFNDRTGPVVVRHVLRDKADLLA